MPWSGHIGLTLLPVLEEKLRDYQSVCVLQIPVHRLRFGIRVSRKISTYAEVSALHHGSLDLSVRQAAEEGLKDGSVKIVCTSAGSWGGLHCDHVFQLGSPKGIARLVQGPGGLTIGQVRPRD